MVQNGKGVHMIGVSLSHGQDPWTSKQKTVHLSLHKVALHLHVGPQQQQAPGLHIEQRSKQHVTSAQQTTKAQGAKNKFAKGRIVELHRFFFFELLRKKNTMFVRK
jgi:hypothetical protein